MPKALNICLLGEYRAAAGRSVALPTRKTELLLAFLAMHAGQAVPRERLRALLWSDRSERQAAGSLRRALSDLRRGIEDAIGAAPLETTPSTVLLRAEATHVDTVQFEDCLSRGTGEDLIVAANTYRGDLLADLSAPDPVFEDWLRVERERLRRLAVDLAERLAVQAQNGDGIEAASELAHRLLATDPACEEAHRALIACLLRTGRTNAARKQYAACEHALRTLLDVSPEEKTSSMVAKGGDTESLKMVTPQAASPTVAGPAEDLGVEERQDSAHLSDADGDSRHPVHASPVVVLGADVAGFQRLVALNSDDALANCMAYIDVIFDLIAEHGGSIWNCAGDRITAAFETPLFAVRAAVAIQSALRRRNADFPLSRRLEYRIGLDIGEVSREEANAVTAGLREVAGPSGICLSEQLRSALGERADFPMVDLGLRAIGQNRGSERVTRLEWHSLTGEIGGMAADQHAPTYKPSIAVLPFINLSANGDEEFFADGLTEDLITALSQYRWFHVIARSSTIGYKNAEPAVEQIGRDLNVHYVVRGSVRLDGQRIRVSGQLVDCASGATLWAQRFDREIAHLFEIQDELVQCVAGAIEPEIIVGETRRVVHQPTSHLGAYEHCMRGLWHHYQTTADNYTEALPWYRKAIALDPNYGRAYVALARTLLARCYCGMSSDIIGDRSEICAAAERALACDNRDPDSHYVMFGCHFLHGRHRQALDAAQRALDLNPNFARGFHALGYVRVFMGQFEAALDPLDTARRLSPSDPMDHFFLSRTALACYHLGDFEAAASMAEQALACRHAFFNLVILLASLGQLGDIDRAGALVPEAHATRPTNPKLYWDTVFPYVDLAHRGQFLDGLAKAGLEV